MNNEEAIELLNELTEQASRLVQASVWATAFLVEGGEPTWDAVKSVSRLTTSVALTCRKVEEFETRFEEIIP